MILNFKQFLLEMPLNYYGHKFINKEPELKNNFDPNSLGARPMAHFSQQDRNLITHPKTFQKLEQILKNSGYNFNILLYESWGHYDYDKAIHSKTDWLKEVEQFIAENGIQIANHITFVKNSSTGDPLTVWILTHTIGHALIKPPTREKMTEILKSVATMPDKFDIIQFWSQIFKFKSIQKQPSGTVEKIKPFAGVSSIEELIYELVAEFLWNGGIRANTSNNPKVSQAVANLERMIQGALDFAEGKIITDFFE